jgi:hypothetical protein
MYIFREVEHLLLKFVIYQCSCLLDLQICNKLSMYISRNNIIDMKYLEQFDVTLENNL